MEKITFSNSEKFYNIDSIMQVSSNLLRIDFTDEVPTSVEGEIDLFTSGGIKATTLSGYSTIYKIDGQTLYLSNSEGVYQEPQPTTPSEPYTPTAEELFLFAQSAKLSEVNAVCRQTIVNGVNVTLSDGSEHHFDLKDEDQIAMLLCASKVASGVEMIPWHPNGDKTLPCVFYSNTDMAIITQAVEAHISYHQTYCNSLKIWIEACQTAEEINTITYGDEIPEQYKSEVLKSYINMTTETVGN